MMQAFVHAIDGWFTEAEGDRLAALALMVPDYRAIVEVGTYKGRSTCWMADANPEAHIFCVDPWAEAWGEALPIFLHNVAQGGWADRITPLRGSAVDIARIWIAPVGLLFLDAVHEYEPTLRDFVAWAPFVPPGGYVAFHDCEAVWPGVQQVVAEALTTGEWDDVDQTESLRVLRRHDAA